MFTITYVVIILYCHLQSFEFGDNFHQWKTRGLDRPDHNLPQRVQLNVFTIADPPHLCTSNFIQTKNNMKWLKKFDFDCFGKLFSLTLTLIGTAPFPRKHMLGWHRKSKKNLQTINPPTHTPLHTHPNNSTELWK